MASSSYSEFERKRSSLLRQEELLLDVTEEIQRALKRSTHTRTELAKFLDKSRAISPNEEGDISLRDLADVAEFLDLRVEIRLVSRKSWKSSD